MLFEDNTLDIAFSAGVLEHYFRQKINAMTLKKELEAAGLLLEES